MASATSAGALRGRFAVVVGVVYLAVVLLVTLWPTTVDRGVDPLLRRVLEKLWSRGVPTFVDYHLVEFSANVLFFVPVGLLLALLLPFRWWWFGAVGGALLSAAVETAQGVFLPGRVSSVEDVVANTAGATIGCLIALAVRLRIRHRAGSDRWG